MRWRGIVAVVAAALGGVAPLAGAQSSGGAHCSSELSSGGVCVELGIPPGDDGAGGGPPGSGPLLIWEDTYGSGEFVCWRVPGGPTEIALAEVADSLPKTAEIAVAHRLFPVDPTTGEPVGPARTVCDWDDEVPAAPPTAAEVWQAVPLPQPIVHVNPASGGIVGLAAWLWADEASTRSVTATVHIRGYTATVTATPERFEWVPGDGSPPLRSGAAGSEAAPAATHAFPRHGQYTVVHRVTYIGRYTLRGHGVTLANRPLGSVSARGERSYTVIEIEAVIHD